MKFFKPKFASKQPVQAQKPPLDEPPADNQSTTVLHSPHPPAKSPMSPPQQQQQQQPTTTAVKSPAFIAGFDSVDASVSSVAPTTVEQKQVKAEAEVVLGSGATEQQQQINQQTDQRPAASSRRPIPTTTIDLDDGASTVELSDGEYADDEGEDEAGGARGAAAAKLAAKSFAVDAAKKYDAMTLFQRKRPTYHQQQQQQPQQQVPNQQPSPQALLGKRSATCCGGLQTMRMRDLIYWCPKDQPPPKWRRESASGTESPASTEPDSLKQAEQQPEPKESLQTDSAVRLAPQVMLDSFGNIVLNEESLYIRETAPAIVEEVREDCTELRATYRSFRNSGGRGSATRGRQWSCKETLRFYKAVSTIGTDFSYMASLFTSRTREELKRKYKREEKANPHLIDQMLKKRKPYDLSMFEPSSDSDIEIDSKNSNSSSSANGLTTNKWISGDGVVSKPSAIVMEGLKKHLSKVKQQRQMEQQEQPVTVVI